MQVGRRILLLACIVVASPVGGLGCGRIHVSKTLTAVVQESAWQNEPGTTARQPLRYAIGQCFATYLDDRKFEAFNTPLRRTGTIIRTTSCLRRNPECTSQAVYRSAARCSTDRAAFPRGGRRRHALRLRCSGHIANSSLSAHWTFGLIPMKSRVILGALRRMSEPKYGNRSTFASKTGGCQLPLPVSRNGSRSACRKTCARASAAIHWLPPTSPAAFRRVVPSPSASSTACAPYHTGGRGEAFVFSSSGLRLAPCCALAT